MAELLISIPGDDRSDHRARAVRVAGALAQATDVRVVTAEDEWDAREIWGGLVFESEGDDRHLARLRAAGRPALYSLSLGPLEHGRPADPSLHEAAHRIPTRLKLQAAGAALVESFAQARAAQDHYGLSTPWLVLPPVPERVWSEPGSAAEGQGKRLLVLGDLDGGIGEAVAAWCEARETALCRLETEDALLAEANQPGEKTVLWLRWGYSGARFLGLCTAGCPVTAADAGVIDPDPVLAEWLAEVTPATVHRALDATLEWKRGHLRAQVGAAAQYDWPAWCETLLTALRRLALSPAAQFLLPEVER